MTATIPAAVATALLVALATAPATHAQVKTKPRGCAAKKSRTLASTALIRVYRRGDAVLACSLRTNRRTRLGTAGECQNQTQATDFRVGRHVVGVRETTCGTDTGRETIRVIDARTGRTRFRVAVADPGLQVNDYSTTITSWAMRSNGSVAWIGRLYGFLQAPPPPEQFQVWKREIGAAGPQQLDSAPDVDQNSLAVGLTGNPAPVYWRKGGTVFSSTLE